jgi:glutamine amidotransferase
VCELFAMASRLPTDARASLEIFARHGASDGPHKDGWGLGYYADEDVRLVKEAEPASQSECVRFLREHPFVCRFVMAHIRKGTQGRIAMKNCQPFARELGGRMHLFAHNGDLDPIRVRERMSLQHFHPLGDTDSEYAFCALLERLRPAWQTLVTPSLQDRLDILARFAAAIRPLGPANFLYSDGDALFIHGHRRFQDDGGAPRPPGLHLLSRHCAPGQRVVLAASVPLTPEPGWRPMGNGELVAARDGVVVAAENGLAAHTAQP